MKTRSVRIGNSRGVRIPKPLLEEAGLEDEVHLTLGPEGILISRRALRAPAGRRPPSSCGSGARMVSSTRSPPPASTAPSGSGNGTGRPAGARREPRPGSTTRTRRRRPRRPRSGPGPRDPEDEALRRRLARRTQPGALDRDRGADDDRRARLSVPGPLPLPEADGLRGARPAPDRRRRAPRAPAGTAPSSGAPSLSRVAAGNVRGVIPRLRSRRPETLDRLVLATGHRLDPGQVHHPAREARALRGGARAGNLIARFGGRRRVAGRERIQ
jgi:hypothetical protein